MQQIYHIDLKGGTHSKSSKLVWCKKFDTVYKVWHGFTPFLAIFYKVWKINENVSLTKFEIEDNVISLKVRIL